MPLNCVCVFIILFSSSQIIAFSGKLFCLLSKLMRFWTVRNVVQHISKSWNNEQWCVLYCNTAKEGSPKLCLSRFAVAMRCDRCIYLFIWWSSPAPHLCVQLMCECSDWTGLSFPSHHLYGSHSSGCFSKLRRRRPRYPDPIQAQGTGLLWERGREKQWEMEDN